MINEINKTDKLNFVLEMYQIDYNESKIESLRNEISKKYDIPLKNINIKFEPITVNNDGDKISLASDIISSIQKPEFQVELFKEYLKLKEIKDVDIKDIKLIDNQINSYIDFDQYSKYKQYKFKYVKWDNYLSYGPDNYFDFTRLKGLVLLNGEPENQAGKTTFAIDLLRFALFGKAEKSPTLDSVFNKYLPETTDVMVEAGIEIDGVNYVIKRTVKRPILSKRTAKSKYKQSIEYFKIINGDLELIENCEGESSVQTNNIIKDSVGNVEDFNLVISATDYNLSNLLKMGQTDKGKLFSRWLGLLSIEKKEEIAKKIWKESISKNLLSNTNNKEELITENSKYNELINKNNNLINESQIIYNESVKKLDYYNNNKDELYKQRKQVKESLCKLDVSTVENNINNKTNEYTSIDNNFNSLKKEYNELKNVNFNNDEYIKIKKIIDLKKNEVHSYELKNIEIKTKIHVIDDNIKRIIDLINVKICPTCGQSINTESKTSEIDNNKKDKKTLINNGISNKNLIDSLNSEIIKLTEEMTNMEIEKERLDKKSRIELKMIAVKSNIDKIKSDLEILNLQKEEILQNKENIEFNNLIDIKIRNVDIDIKVEDDIKLREAKNIQTFENENKNYKIEIEKRDKLIKRLIDEEKIIKNWNIYLELIGKQGIIKIVLKRALPILNNEINRVLCDLCDFNVKVEIDDDNNLSVNMYRDGCVFDLGTCGSGLETTFSSLALRNALASISSISKPSFLVLDEVDSRVAKTNYDKLVELYRRILNNYDFIFHICHNQMLEDIHDMVITVVKENNISKISNN